jgi:glyoxylase-like metal-dependent hydrolase (beta-lactamase superfamily II)
VILPPQIEVIERDWLSSNNILLHEAEGAVLIDSGYVAHAARTLALVAQALRGRPLLRLINTHCHSDHMGGNAALARAHGCRISVPAGEAAVIAAWDEDAMMLADTGQSAERFSYSDTVAAGDVLELGGLQWQALAAPGHDPNALMFHAPEARLLITGDALWENGFGLIFPELFGQSGFAAARATLETIARLEVDTVIPGHGAPFGGIGKALATAFARLDAYERDPAKLARHALKVMLSFSLMIRGSLAEAELPGVLAGVPIYGEVNRRFLRLTEAQLCEYLVKDLERARALTRRDGRLFSMG